ncbi:hypothetical protein M8J76_016753 [Diaphorina citri]|nr:hypothetical protein M8J76_016753 [Diaphorina citri]
MLTNNNNASRLSSENNKEVTQLIATLPLRTNADLQNFEEKLKDQNKRRIVVATKTFPNWEEFEAWKDRELKTFSYYAKKCGKKTGKTDYFYCQKDGSSKAHCKTGEAPRKTSRKISIGSVKKDNICISSMNVEHQDSGIHRGHGENARRLDQKSIGYLLRAFTKRSKTKESENDTPSRPLEIPILELIKAIFTFLHINLTHLDKGVCAWLREKNGDNIINSRSETGKAIVKGLVKRRKLSIANFCFRGGWQKVQNQMGQPHASRKRKSLETTGAGARKPLKYFEEMKETTDTPLQQPPRSG